MKTGLKLNWVGPWIPERNLSQWKAASPAAMKWQKHLVNALIARGVEVNWMFYRPDPYWPRGRLFPWRITRKGLIPPIGNSAELPYVNLLRLREFSLSRACTRRITTAPQQKQLIVSYNSPEWLKDSLLQLSTEIEVCWISIVADSLAPEGADGCVFLSHGYCERFSDTIPKMHLDGGIYPIHNGGTESVYAERCSKTKFMYSGSLGKWGGVLTLLDALDKIDSDDFNVAISGPGIIPKIYKRIKADKRVTFLGVLEENELSSAYASADVFLNPRPTKISMGENNFPSKLLDYLAWGKPIISTWTDGLAPEYRHVLNVVDDNAESVAAEMMRLMHSGSNHLRPVEWASRFNKTWDQQAARLSEFVSDLC